MNSHTIPAIENLYSRNGLQTWLQNRGLRASKALGQNFLCDKNLLQALLEDINLPTKGSVIEIGPGLGHLTWQLLHRGLNVTAVELDNSFIHSLHDVNTERMKGLQDENPPLLHVIRQDALKTNFSELANETGSKHVIGNLPYNISVPLLFALAMTEPPFTGIHAMIQKEVGDRILAEPSTKEYGRLSIVLNYLCEIKHIRTVSPNVFLPKPNVSSVFISLLPKPNTDKNFVRQFLERLVQLGFRHRRKKLRSQLKHAIIEKRVLNDDFMQAMESRFDFDCRAEELSVDTWVAMADYIRSQPPYPHANA